MSLMDIAFYTSLVVLASIWPAVRIYNKIISWYERKRDLADPDIVWCWYPTCDNKATYYVDNPEEVIVGDVSGDPVCQNHNLYEFDYFARERTKIKKAIMLTLAGGDVRVAKGLEEVVDRIDCPTSMCKYCKEKTWYGG